jgi:antitoxin VapB
MENDIRISWSSTHSMPLYIKDATTTRLVNELARQRGLTKQAAVRLAVQAELDRAAARVPLRERLARLWAEHPMPPATGEAADKAFFDELAGEP